MLITLSVVNVWTGTKSGCNDPVGTDTRTNVIDLLVPPIAKDA